MFFLIKSTRIKEDEIKWEKSILRLVRSVFPLTSSRASFCDTLRYVAVILHVKKKGQLITDNYEIRFVVRPRRKILCFVSCSRRVGGITYSARPIPRGKKWQCLLGLARDTVLNHALDHSKEPPSSSKRVADASINSESREGPGWATTSAISDRKRVIHVRRTKIKSETRRNESYLSVETINPTIDALSPRRENIRRYVLFARCVPARIAHFLSLTRLVSAHVTDDS